VANLPVIVGFGGINAAGRTSFHHAFLRLVHDVLPATEQQKMLRSLSHLMGRGDSDISAAQSILDDTLIREISTDYFDTERVYSQSRAELQPTGEALVWKMRKRDLPTPVPGHWEVTDTHDGHVTIHARDNTSVLLGNTSPCKVRVAGQLPRGFDPAAKYPSRSHPRGLQLAIYAASDAVHSVGISWDHLLKRIPADKVSVYASSCMGQLDEDGSGGMLQNVLVGKRCTSKNLALGMAQMSADFVNAYVLGNVGGTGGTQGACATVLYNLERAVNDIQSGRAKLAVVGASDAPITPEIIEGYRIMGALAEDRALMALDGITDGAPDYRRACRPFGFNCGFTLGESAQYIVLMSDDLALEVGATIYGAVPGVFINADGFKKSISSPGIGNYLTLGRACGMAEKILGSHALRNNTLLHAHGTGTPQNRTSESHVFDQIASAFSISNWRVAGTKCFTGHSLGAASGDQIAFALGTFATGIAPGIVTVEQFADDVHRDRLTLSNRHAQEETHHWQGAFINSKGFGGNNATGFVLSSHATLQLLQQKHGAAALRQYASRNEVTREKQSHYEAALLNGHDNAIYHFGDRLVDENTLVVTHDAIQIPGYDLPISLDTENPYGSIEGGQ
jgi:acetoacetyl-[acyl-carrier protein] synthase